MCDTCEVDIGCCEVDLCTLCLCGLMCGGLGCGDGDRCCFCLDGDICCRTKANTRTNSKQEQARAKRLHTLRQSTRADYLAHINHQPHTRFSDDLANRLRKLIVLSKAMDDINAEVNGGKHVIHVLAERNDITTTQHLYEIIGGRWFEILKHCRLHRTQNQVAQMQQQYGNPNPFYMQQVSQSTGAAAPAPPPPNYGGFQNDFGHPTGIQNHQPGNLSPGTLIFLPVDIAQMPELKQMLAPYVHPGEIMQRGHDRMCVECRGCCVVACQSCGGFATQTVKEGSCCCQKEVEKPGCNACRSTGIVSPCPKCQGTGNFTGEKSA